MYSSTPIVTDDTVYLQDINSNVQAVDRATGEVKWTKKFDSLSAGPNGVAIGGGLVVGGTADGAFALDADTGEVVWEKLKLDPPGRQRGRGHGPAGLERHRDTSAPCRAPSLANFYGVAARGIVYALDLATGEEKWKFDTTTDDLWGNPKLNTGGGLWADALGGRRGQRLHRGRQPRSVAGHAGVPRTARAARATTSTPTASWCSTARPARSSGTTRPSPTTCATGTCTSARSSTDFTIDGKETPVVVLSGKIGTVYVVNRDTHELIWKKDVGKHTPEAGFQDGIGTTLQGTKVTKARPTRTARTATRRSDVHRPGRRYPGWLGGVETAMAVSDGVIYVPVNNLCAVYFRQANYTEGSELCDFATSSRRAAGPGRSHR